MAKNLYILCDTVVKTRMRNVRIESFQDLETSGGILEIVNDHFQQVRFGFLVHRLTERHHTFAARRLRNAYVHILVAARSNRIEEGG